MFGLQFINDMENMQRDMGQLFRSLGVQPAYRSLEKPISMKVVDRGENLAVEAPLPGLDIEKLDIRVLGRRLTIAGEFLASELPENVRWHRQERRGGSFESHFQLSADIDLEKIEAEYKQGILRITLPKAASALPKKITVKVD